MIPQDLLPAFRETLLKGAYNLLFGSGVSLDSRNSRGELLRSSEELRSHLCSITGVRASTSLTRVYSLLTPKQVQDELVGKFSGCKPGPSVTHLAHFLWRRLFTFNVDDVIENLYSSAPQRKQVLISLNFDSPLEPTPERNELHGIHLHGSVARPKSGFVFSAAEYARVMSRLNPWMHLLSEILATEPFIIAGTCLNEIDLEFYLSHRTSETPRRGRGPSLLIEPNPDLATRSDCARYGLTLVQSTFGDFMEWLHREFPTPPSVADLIVPDSTALFSAGLTPIQLLRFFSDFETVAASEQPLSRTPSPYLYGLEPSWEDLNQHVDVERHDNDLLIRLLNRIYGSEPGDAPRLVLVLDDAGTGKTTVIKRVAHELAGSGRPVLTVRTFSRIDTENAITCLSRLTTALLLLVDGLADHADEVMDLLENNAVASHVIILGAERSYRQEYLNVVLGPTKRITGKLIALTLNERKQLVERYRQYGLVGTHWAMKEPSAFAERLSGEAVAIAACRILNDFRPLVAIVESLWEAAHQDDRHAYLCVALAHHCYWVGLRYSLLQAIMGPARPIDHLINNEVPLRLAANPGNDDFVVALNPVISEQLVHMIARREVRVLLEAFVGVSSAIAPHVNRKAVMRRSPEARLAGRLFDADKIVRPLLGELAEEFYISVQNHWEWNSRYWEQRALLIAKDDLETAIHYARHAVALERHPFSLTTLAKLLLMSIERNAAEVEGVFDQAFKCLTDAIEIEASRLRITVHPFGTLLTGAARYIELGGILTGEQRNRLSGYATEARARFAGDSLIEAANRRLDSLLA